jgi:hypothetical protein
MLRLFSRICWSRDWAGRQAEMLCLLICAQEQRGIRPIATDPHFSLIQARLCYRPLAYGKALTRPIGKRHSATRAQAPGLSTVRKKYRIGPICPKMAGSDPFHRTNAWPIRFDFSESMESEFVLTFQNPCPADSIHDSDSGVTSINWPCSADCFCAYR